ncbi:glycosyltransferase [Mycolicibacterium hodleri]
MRLLLVTPIYPPTRGGIQTLLYQLTASLPGTDVKVITAKERGWEAHDASSGQLIKRVWVPEVSPLIRNAMFNFAALGALYGWRPDVVLCGHIVASPASWMIAKRFKAAHVVYAYGREIGIRPALAAWALRRSNAAIAISAYTRGELLAAAHGATLPPIHVVSPGVNLPDDIGRCDASRPTVLTVARMRDWYKGHDRLLDALPLVIQEVPNVHWVVIGEGKIRAELERRAKAAALLGNVSFLGEVDEDVKESWLSCAHVFAMPSRYPEDEAGGEGFGIVYLEAGARGLPSVASNIGAPTEVVVDGKTGILVDADSPPAIAAALIRLLTDADYARKLGSAARRRVETGFTWELVGQQLHSVLDEVAIAQSGP